VSETSESTGTYCECGRSYKMLGHRCPAAASLHHPQCINAVTILQWPDLVCLDCRMPYVDGKSLSARPERRGAGE
jgi:CheY-like chemotaxis protein